MKKMNFISGIIVIAALTMAGGQVNAQRRGSSSSSDAPFTVGSMSLNIGIGPGRSSFGNYGEYGGGYYGYGTGLGVKVAAERGMWQVGPGVISLGAEIGASFSSGNYYNYKSNIFILAARAAYHYGFNVPRLDVYAGPSLGPGVRSYDYGNFNTPGTHHDVIAAFGFFGGGSYYFTPRFGVNAEVGYDITLIQGGVIFKMN